MLSGNKILIFSLFFGINFSVFAQTKFQTIIAKNTFGLNEQIKISYQINSNASNFQAPNFDDFTVLKGPIPSTNINIVNGRMTTILTYTFVLRAEKMGEFTIGKATIESGNKKFETKPFQIKITKSVPKSNNPNDPINIARKNIYFRAIVNKRNVYLGEAISLTYKIYYKIPVSNLDNSNKPSFKGFWTQEVKLPDQFKSFNDKFKGQNFKAAKINKYIIIPQRAGKLSIDPFLVNVIVQLPTNKRDHFGRTIYEQFNIPFYSNKININVLPLPSKNKPANFSGAVGKYNFKSELNKTKTKANESVSLKLTVNGNGNLKLFNLPDIKIPNDIEIYDPKISDNIQIKSNNFYGIKSKEFLLIPRYEGEYKIPATSFSFFDIDKKDYVTINQPEYLLKVEGGNSSQNPSSFNNSNLQNVDKESIEYLDKDILFIQTGKANFREKGENFLGSKLFYSLLFLPFLFFIGLFILAKNLNNRNADVIGLKNRKANKMAQKRLKLAESYLKENNRSGFYEEVTKALEGYLIDKLNLEKSNLNKLNIEVNLQNQNVPDELIKKLFSTLDECEFARFAIGSQDSEMLDLYNGSMNLIADLENQLTKK